MNYKEDSSTNQSLYVLIQQLADRCSQLELDVARLSVISIVSQPKLIESVDDYFRKIPIPTYRFNQLSEIIVVDDDDITNLFDRSSRETLSGLLRRNIYTLLSTNGCPIHVYHKKLYTYDYDYDKINNEDSITVHFPKWRVCILGELTYLLNHIQKIIISKLMSWKVKQDSIRISADACDIMYQKALQKILKIDFKLATTSCAIKNIITKIYCEWCE